MDHAIEPRNAADERGPLRRVLGPLDATCVVVGAIIGVGIFFNPSRVAALAGSAEMALLAWAVGGLIALCGALTFAELGVRYPHAGGQYVILRDAYGPLPAFLFVFCNATAVQAGAIAIIALLCAQNLAIAATGEQLLSPAAVALSTLLIAAVTAANAVGVRWGARIANLTVAAKLTTLAVVILIAVLLAPSTTRTGAALNGAAAADAAIADGPAPAPTGPAIVLLFAAIVPSFFAYGGWQQALWVAGEVRAPRKNLPRAIVGGVLIVVVAYVLVNWAYLHLLGYHSVTTSGALAADAVAIAWPHGGRRLAAAAVAVSAFGVLNAQLLTGPRLIFRMAEDRRFFAPFALVNGRFGTPLPAIALLGTLGLALLWLAAAFSRSPIDAIDRLTTGVVFIDGVFFALSGLALFVLRRRPPTTHAARGAVALSGDAVNYARSGETDPSDDPPEPGVPTRAPRLGYPLAPALFVLGEIGIILGAYADPAMRHAALIGVGWIAAAAVLFLVCFRRRQSR